MPATTIGPSGDCMLNDDGWVMASRFLPVPAATIVPGTTRHCDEPDEAWVERFRAKVALVSWGGC